MRKIVENRFGLLALVLVAIGALYGVAFATRPAPVARAAATPLKAPVESVTTVCPSPSGTRVSVITPSGAQGPGAATLGAVAPPTGKNGKPAKPQAPLGVIQRPGRLWQREVPAGGGPLAVAATGSMAAGLEASQTAREKSGTQRGLAGVRCVEPGNDAWFVGPGPAAAEMTLYLTNADAAPADVTFMVYSGEGPVLSERGNGMILQPGESRVVNLRDLAPSPLVMALEVSTGSGRVAAAVKAVYGKGLGVDWIPAAAPPATRVVVPGIPGIAGPRELYVTAPGEQDTVVQVKAVLKDGSYALKNKETVEVPAGSTATFDLTTGVSGQAAALVLTADVPIVAGLKITGTGSSQDVAFTAGAPSIDLGSVVADGRSAKKQVSRLVLSAPFTAATVRVQLLPADGTPPAPVEVKLPAARTRELTLTPPPGGASFSVVVQPQPGSGPVYGGRVVDEPTPDGEMLTAQPLAVARIWALVPPTADSPGAVLP
ncbi:hypothetical protein GCM10009530_50680 [Microbispora corallina]|uniref:Secreted protein n=1 Tax=Microbispora corallina TaxID=83302 RepID=A0ABQ4G6G0_9ACTN|nr:DUF5719 family protein [Microbispora corallina]GIH42661.1 hypothetical protein Mco01_56610 [Microbispora corallina]